MTRALKPPHAGGGLWQGRVLLASSIRQRLPAADREPTWAKLCHLAQALHIEVSALALADEAEVHGAMCVPGADPLPRVAA